MILHLIRSKRIYFRKFSFIEVNSEKQKYLLCNKLKKQMSNMYKTKQKLK